MVDWDAIRKDFPVLAEKREGKPIVYFDNACVALKPKFVVDAMNNYYFKHTACAGRSIHKFATETTEAFEAARAAVSKFLNTSAADEIVFTRNTTDGINLVAQGLPWKKGDEVVTLDMEHNSNLLPWQRLAKCGIVHKISKTHSDGAFNLEEFKKALSKRTKLVSIIHTSNVFGTTAPAKEIAKLAHEVGALVMLDAAQSVPHTPIDVRSLDCDFLAFSGHKLYGPSGTGVLYGKMEHLEKLERMMVGGETVVNTTYESEEIAPVPMRLEPGLQNYAGVIGLGAAVNYVTKIGMKNIEARDKQLARRLLDTVKSISNVKIMSSLNPSGPLVSFNVGNLDANEVAVMLDDIANIFVRSGRHCVHSWFNAHNVRSSARASLAFYNSESEIELFGETLKKVAELA